jgi:hypothetical protein
MFYKLTIFTFLAAFIILVGCKDDTSNPDITSAKDTWAVIQDEIFEANCVSCHTEGSTFAKQSGLVLDKEVAYQNLANVFAKNEAAAKQRLILLETTGLTGLHASFLWEKINVLNQDHFYDEHPEFGELMPSGGAPPLTNGELEYIRTWIVAGAPETGVVADEELLNNKTRYYGSQTFEPLEKPEFGYQLHVGPFDVLPKYEREFYAFTALGNTEEVYVNRFETAMRPGTHHLILYDFWNRTTYPPHNELRDIRYANGQYNPQTFESIENQLYVFGTQLRSTDYSYPDGVAMKVSPNKSYDVNTHYTNYGDTTITGEVYVNLHTIPKSEVQHVAKQFLVSDNDFVLPARKVTTIHAEHGWGDTRNIFMLTAHAHQTMTEFKIFIKGGDRDGELVYYTNDWEHPVIEEYDPPIVLNPGEKLRTETTYNNTTNKVLRFGLLSTDEMNIVFGAYY